MNRDEHRKRILMAPDYTESNPYQRELISALSERDVAVTAVPVTGVFPLLSAVRREGIPDIVHLHWLHRFLISERRFPQLIAAILGIRLLLEILVLRLLGAKVIWTVHNLADHERNAPRMEVLVRRLVAGQMDRIIVHCESAKESITDTYRLSDRIAANIRVVPHGTYQGVYPDAISRSAARTELGVSEANTVILFFGLIRPYKNVPGLIAAFREQSDPAARLVIAGNPWSTELATQIAASAEADDRIQTTLEFIPDAEIQRYFRAADAVVLPFDTVLTSGSAILGMSFGRAVVSPAVGCLPALLGENGGILYDPDSPGGLEHALEQALADRERLATMGRRNAEAMQEYSWGHIADHTLAVYNGEAGSDPIGERSVAISSG